MTLAPKAAIEIKTGWEVLVDLVCSVALKAVDQNSISMKTVSIGNYGMVHLNQAQELACFDLAPNIATVLFPVVTVAISDRWKSTIVLIIQDLVNKLGGQTAQVLTKITDTIDIYLWLPQLWISNNGGN